MKTKRTLIPILAAMVAWFSGILIVLLSPQPLFMLGSLGGAVVGWLIFRWLVTKAGLVGALSVIGVAILSGFLGSFVGVIDFISPLYNTVRWIAPLLLMMIGIRNALQAKKAAQYLMTIWGSISRPIVWFVLYALISALYSSAPLITTGRAVTFSTITIGLAAALWPVIRQQADAERILRLIALVMALIILPGELYIFFPDSIGWHSSGRFRSTFWNPVTFSHLCALLLPLYWWIGIDRRITSGRRTASRAMMAILIINIYLTGSRSGALALLVSLLFLSWHFTAQKSRHLVNWLLIAMLTFAIILQPQVTTNYFTRGTALENTYQITSGRITPWELALVLWSNSPVLGSGFGVIGNTDQSLFSSGGSSSLQSSTASLRLSNLYLETLASGGLIGAGLLLYLLFQCLMMFRRAVEHASQEKRFMMLMAFATFISGLILNLSETWLISAGSPFAMYWWLVLFLASRVATLEAAAKSPRLLKTGRTATFWEKTREVGAKSVSALPPPPPLINLRRPTS